MASVAVLRPVDASPHLDLVRRAPAPSHLGEDEKAVWRRIVDAKPADWFGPEHMAQLAAYCRAVVTIERLTQQIDAFRDEWLADDDGLKRMDRLLKMRQKETAIMHALARGMRLTQQSVIVAHKAGAAKRQMRRPWEIGQDAQEA